MGLLWQNLDEEYKAWLSPNICTPEEYEGSSLVDRAQLRKQFLAENRRSCSDNDIIQDDAASVCTPPDNLAEENSDKEGEDRKKSQVVNPPSPLPLKKRKITGISKSNHEEEDDDNEQQSGRQKNLTQSESEKGSGGKSRRKTWCWLLTLDGKPSMGGLESKETKRNEPRAQKNESRKHHKRSWNWLLAPDGSPSMGPIQEEFSFRRSSRRRARIRPRPGSTNDAAEMINIAESIDEGDVPSEEPSHDAGEMNEKEGGSDQVGLASKNTAQGQQISEETKVKKEEEHEVAKRDAYEKYGDRLLLHRFDGVGLLGGGIQHTFQRPNKTSSKVWNGNNLRDGYPLPEMGLKIDANGDTVYDMDAFTSLAYNTLWQVNGPKFAGQPTAAVNVVPKFMKEKELALPVFMKRSLTKKSHKKETKVLGWEYVGNYKCITDNDLITWESANNFTAAMKQEIVMKYLQSADRKGDTYGAHAINWWRDLLQDKEQEQKENKKKTEDPKSIFSRAKALGFETDMNDKDLINLIVELNEFHSQEIIEFVNYDERIYKLCSKGPTTKNANGCIQAKEGGIIATARDWYNFANENMLL